MKYILFKVLYCPNLPPRRDNVMIMKGYFAKAVDGVERFFARRYVERRIGDINYELNACFRKIGEDVDGV